MSTSCTASRAGGSMSRRGDDASDSHVSQATSTDSRARHDSLPEADRLLLIRLLEEVTADGERRERSSALGALLERSRKPLTIEEERVLFRRMNYLTFQADAVRCSLARSRSKARREQQLGELEAEAADVRRRIAESNIRLVVSIARKFSRGSDPFQELVSEGLFILLGAIDKFDVSRGFRFSTYATHAVQRHYFRATQRMQRYGERFVLTAGDVMAAASQAVDSDPEPPVDHVQVYHRLMDTARGQLSEREEFVLQRRFGTEGEPKSLTLRETAAEMGISKERVRQIQTAALEKLRAIATQMNLASAIG